MGKLVPDPFVKNKRRMSISLGQQSEMLYKLVLLYIQSEALPKYIITKVLALLALTLYKAF